VRGRKLQCSRLLLARSIIEVLSVELGLVARLIVSELGGNVTLGWSGVLDWFAGLIGGLVDRLPSAAPDEL
jgi:hypothetical protein